jgi:uncharacterized protein
MRLGTVARLFRYPVKSMRGEELQQTPVGLQGLPGDRRYAFVQAQNRSVFPWLTGRQVAEMLHFRPRFEGGYDGSGREPALLVELPDGRLLGINDPALQQALEQQLGAPLFLLRDHRGNYDVGQVSLFSLDTAAAIGACAGRDVDPRRFRANLYLQPDAAAIPESEWTGKVLAIGPDLRLAVTQPDERCMMVNLDPDTAANDPAVLRAVATEFGNRAGVYASVLRPGLVSAGDAVEVVG